MRRKIIVYGRILIGCFATLLFAAIAIAGIQYALRSWDYPDLTAPVYIILIVFAFTKVPLFLLKRNLRKMTPEEYESFADRNLIHFGPYPQLSPNGKTIFLEAGQSDVQHISLPLVWFHLSDPLDKSKPLFRSFWTNHYTEWVKPAAKVIVPLRAIPIERIGVRPHDNAVTIFGNLESNGTVETEFSWNEDRFYILPTLQYSLVSFFIALISMASQASRIWDWGKKHMGLDRTRDVKTRSTERSREQDAADRL